MSVDKAVGAFVAGSLINNLGSALLTPRGITTAQWERHVAEWKEYAHGFQEALDRANAKIRALNSQVQHDAQELEEKQVHLRTFDKEYTRLSQEHGAIVKALKDQSSERAKLIDSMMGNITALADQYQTKSEALQVLADVADRNGEALLLAEARMIGHLYSQAAHIIALPRLLSDLSVSADAVEAARSFSLNQLADRDGDMRSVLQNATRIWLGRKLMDGAGVNITCKDNSGGGRLLARIRINDAGEIDLEHYEGDLADVHPSLCSIEVDGYAYPYARSPSLSILAKRMEHIPSIDENPTLAHASMPFAAQLCDPEARLPGEPDEAFSVRMKERKGYPRSRFVEETAYRRLSLNLDEYQHTYSSIGESISVRRERVPYAPALAREGDSEDEHVRGYREMHKRQWESRNQQSKDVVIGDVLVNSAAYRVNGVAVVFNDDKAFVRGDHYAIVEARKAAEAAGFAHPLADTIDPIPLARFRICERVVHAVLGLSDEAPDTPAALQHEQPISKSDWDACLNDLSKHLVKALSSARQVTPQVVRRLSAEEETAEILSAPTLEDDDGMQV